MNNTSDTEIQNRDAYLRSIGSSPLYDAIFLIAFPPFGCLALVGNLISYRILTARYFQQKPLYAYLRATCLNSSIINFVFAITFLCESRRYLVFANTEWAIFFRCYFKIPVINTCYFYGSILDIVLSLDRLVEFTRFKQRFRQINAHRLCIILLVVCIVLNLPYIFVFEPKMRRVHFVDANGDRSSENSYYYGESAFASSSKGAILKNIHYIIRDFLTLVVMVLFNIVTLVLLK